MAFGRSGIRNQNPGRLKKGDESASQLFSLKKLGNSRGWQRLSWRVVWPYNLAIRLCWANHLSISFDFSPGMDRGCDCANLLGDIRAVCI